MSFWWCKGKILPFSFKCHIGNFIHENFIYIFILFSPTTPFKSIYWIRLMVGLYMAFRGWLTILVLSFGGWLSLSVTNNNFTSKDETLWKFLHPFWNINWCCPYAVLVKKNIFLSFHAYSFPVKTKVQCLTIYPGVLSLINFLTHFYVIFIET